jgi:CheY-like chemotaxis protein
MTHTVLVVEDEEELRDVLRESLELNGYNVVAVGDGEQALAELERIEQVCLVLLDLVMPRMNGWDFFDKLRGRANLADVPVIVHTSSPRLAPAGATRVLKKPFEFERLLSLVKEFCAA